MTQGRATEASSTTAAELSPDELTEHLAAIVRSASHAIIGTTVDGIIVSWNAAAERLYGHAAGEVVGQHVSLLVPDDRPDRLLDAFEGPAASTREDHYETVRVCKDGTLLEVSETRTPIPGRGPGAITGTAVFARDITDRKRADARLEHWALHDPLTQLPNRLLLGDRVAQSLAHSQRTGEPMAVLFLDLDHFKVVNDRMGHAAGDQVLRMVARRLEESVRAGDSVARFGGDEFVVVCESLIGEHEASAVAGRLLASLQEPFQLQGRQITLDASVGVAIGQAGDVPDALLGDADAAMYRAKAQGGGRIERFDPSDRESHRDVGFDLEIDLRDADEGRVRFDRRRR